MKCDSKLYLQRPQLSRVFILEEKYDMLCVGYISLILIINSTFICENSFFIGKDLQ